VCACVCAAGCAQVRNQLNFEAARAALQYATDRQEWAARVIQGAWQGFRNKRIYQYYRDLVQFRCAQSVNVAACACGQLSMHLMHGS